MAFLGYERPIEYTGQQIFDPTMAKMVLDAQDKYFNAVYADYQQGLENMKEFKKEYGDFITPILADQEWYNNNVTGRVRNFINDAYSKGIDLTRSAEGRAAIAQMINSIDVGKISKLRSSAENAKEYLREQAKLEAAGLYNPLLEKYAGKGMDTFSTLGGDGIWGRMSPTRITDMSTFGNPYFEGMKPNVHRESKNGIDFSVEEINEQDLRNVADAHFNELVSTPQGQLMYKYYRDLAGGDNNPNADAIARERFNNAVVDGQRRRIYRKDDYDDNYYKAQNLALQRASQQLQRDKFNWDKAMDLLQLGVDENGNPLPSAGGYGPGANNLPTIGAADQVMLDQNKQYVQQKNNYIKFLTDNETAAYKNLNSEGQKILAKKYKDYLSVLSDKKATKQDKQKAAAFISKWEQNGPEPFKKWAEAYKKSINKDQEWIRHSSSIADSTEWGKTQSEMDLYNKAKTVFQRQNILQSAVDAGVQTDMNSSLGIRKDGNDMVGSVKSDTQFAPITEANATGSRRYKYNSLFNKINRLIQGKTYKVTTDDQTSYRYGHGSINKVDYDMISHNGRFSDERITKELDKYTEESLAAIGITKNQDGSYNIPMISKFSRGSQTWGNVNTETDKRVGGQSEATKHRSTRQAGPAMNRIQ